MQVIPVINCKTEECVRERLEVFEGLDSDWIKFDISDGKFNPVVSWNDPEGLVSMTDGRLSGINIETHLMVESPKDYLESWLDAGARRVIVHIESDFNFEKVKKICEDNEAELMLALKPDTPVEDFAPFLEKVDYVQLLAVTPGYSGQKLQPRTLKKIRDLKRLVPGITIEIDGGINNETAKAVKEAGADIVVSSSYIFCADNPQDAFRELKSI